jgi:hypothetical protein
MADTGAPWNLPYPLSSDLVKDGATNIKDLAEATATGLSNIPVLAGIGSNVVQTVKTDQFSASVATGAESGNVTGLTVTITPSSATSKVLVVCQISAATSGSTGANSGVGATLYRGTTAILRGDSSSTYSRVTTGSSDGGFQAGNSLIISYLDSPGVATAVTYAVRLRHTGTGTLTVYVGRPQESAGANRFVTASTITAIEVAA